MQITLICENSKLESLKKQVADNLGSPISMQPASANGSYPATHWYSLITVDEAGLATIKSSLKDCTVVERGLPTAVTSNKLKIILD